MLRDVLANVELSRKPDGQPNSIVRLVDIMPRMVQDGVTADSAIVQAARVSYQEGTKTISDDKSLIRYLLRKKHTSPIEMIELKWHIKLPIFVARQWIRHRTASVNEISARYSELPDTFYLPTPDNVRLQSQVNKQGSDGKLTAEQAQIAIEKLNANNESCYRCYKELLDMGVAREQARLALPFSIYTEWYWKIDLHNLLHFLMLRLDIHAQQEIRELAQLMYNIVKEICPVSVEAFDDYINLDNTISLSKQEISIISTSGLGKIPVENTDEYREKIGLTNKREFNEFKAKLSKLDLI